MARIETSSRTLPVVAPGAGAGGKFSSPRDSAAQSEFLSQLIAERHHMAPQRARRQAPLADALNTYDAGGRLSVRRLPPGYRTDIRA